MWWKLMKYTPPMSKERAMSKERPPRSDATLMDVRRRIFNKMTPLVQGTAPVRIPLLLSLGGPRQNLARPRKVSYGGVQKKTSKWPVSSARCAIFFFFLESGVFHGLEHAKIHIFGPRVIWANSPPFLRYLGFWSKNGLFWPFLGLKNP